MESLIHYLENFNTSPVKAAYVYGPPGCGKTFRVKQLLQGYDVIEYPELSIKNVVDALDEMAPTNVLSFFTAQKRAKVLVLDDLDSREKNALSALIKYLRKKPPLPIVCIGTSSSDKKTKDFMKCCVTISYPPPTREEMRAILGAHPRADEILRISRGDLTKMIHLKRMENVALFETHSSMTSKEFTARLFRENLRFEDHYQLSESDRTIVGMLWHENALDHVQDPGVYRGILREICFADVVDRAMFQKQIWRLGEMSSLLKTIYTSSMLPRVEPREIRFTKILTKYSTEYSNVGFIEELCRTLLVDRRTLLSGSVAVPAAERERFARFLKNYANVWEPSSQKS